MCNLLLDIINEFIKKKAQRALRITPITTFLNRNRITDAGSLNMPLEELEEKELARKTMIRPLIQERTTGQKKKRGRKAYLYD